MAPQAVIPDLKLAAVCGLFCPGCSVYLATQRGRAEQEKLAQRFQRSVEDVTCYGCRSAKRSFFCEQRCTFVACAAKRGVQFCGQCQDYPCADLKAFQAAAPHRAELWASQERIREVGWERWLQEMAASYACPSCGTMGSAYDVACPSCGRAPANRFVEQHEREISAHRAKK